MFDALFKKNPRKIIENEIRESELLILQAHTNKEHWDAQISYHTTKLKRLRSAWITMQKDEVSKISTKKDSPE